MATEGFFRKVEILLPKYAYPAYPVLKIAGFKNILTTNLNRNH